jgi:phage/plasmid-like protein (TIGR03299 family)
MAHMIDFTVQETGGIAITYNGQTPWHGYGNRVHDDATLDDWRIAAGLNWDVEERDIHFYRKLPDGFNPVSGPGRIETKIPNRKALVRNDTQDVLSIVSQGYHVVQPEEVLHFYEDLIRLNDFKMETAGSLADGRRIWALAKIGEETRLYGQDKVEGYLLLATSYDGTLATTAQFTSVRVVCNNTLELATGAGNVAYKANHDKKWDAEEAKGVLGLSKAAWELYTHNLNQLANTTVDLETAMSFFTAVLGKDAVNIDAETGKASYSTTFHKMFAAYERGPGAELRSAKHTAWGLVNAVTFYQDHMARGNASGSRLNSSWFGAGKSRKSRAFEEALKLAA